MIRRGGFIKKGMFIAGDIKMYTETFDVQNSRIISLKYLTKSHEMITIPNNLDKIKQQGIAKQYMLI